MAGRGNGTSACQGTPVHEPQETQETGVAPVKADGTGATRGSRSHISINLSRLLTAMV